MNKLNSTDFEQRCYIFSINAISFVKSMQKAGLQNEKTILLMKLAAQVNSKISDAYDLENEELIKKVIAETLDLAKKCHEILMNLRAGNDKLLLKEKADLQIETSFLVKDFEEFLQNLE